MTRLCSDRVNWLGFKRSSLLLAAVFLTSTGFGHHARADAAAQQNKDTLPNQAKAAADINITNAWLQNVKDVPNAVAAYFSVENHSDAAHLLNGVTSSLCDTVLGYHSDQENTDATTKLFTHLALPATTTLVFPPGGYHLSCRNVKLALKPGDTVDFTFAFMGGSTKVVRFTMRGGSRSESTY